MVERRIYAPLGTRLVQGSGFESWYGDHYGNVVKSGLRPQSAKLFDPKGREFESHRCLHSHYKNLF